MLLLRGCSRGHGCFVHVGVQDLEGGLFQRVLFVVVDSANVPLSIKGMTFQQNFKVTGYRDWSYNNNTMTEYKGLIIILSDGYTRE